MLKATQLSKEYWLKEQGKKRKFSAVKSTSLELPTGARCALVGESGSGKTTLVRMLAGIITPTAGIVELDGQNIFLTKNRRAVYRKLQIVFQDAKSALNPQMTVYDLIAEPLYNLQHISHAEAKGRVYELMDRMELPLEYCRRKPQELSGGQQKRVSIARAVGVEPEIIIFDESFSGLDVIVRMQILELLDDLQKELKCTYLIITHDMDVALYIADTIFVMKEGTIVEQVQYRGNKDCFHHAYSRQLLEYA